MPLSQSRKDQLYSEYTFKKYVYDFYGYHSEGLYLQNLKLTQEQINKYCDIYFLTFKFCYPQGTIAFDSVDRERVRTLIEQDCEAA